MRTQADDADQGLCKEGAKNPGLGHPLLEPARGFGKFVLKRRGEYFRMLPQSLETDVPVEHGVGACQQSDMRIGCNHGDVLASAARELRVAAQLPSQSCDLSRDARFDEDRVETIDHQQYLLP